MGRRREIDAGAGRSRRRVGALLAAVAAAIVILMASVRVRHMLAARAVPPLPDLGSQTAAVREHLREAFAAAAGNPSDSAAVGSYCVALQADMFLDAAQRCHELVQGFDAAAWRSSYYRALILTERGGGDETVRALREVIAQAPDFAPAWWHLGDAEFKRGRYNAAAQAWSRAEAAPEPDRGTDEPVHDADVPVAAYADFGLARVALAEGRTDDADRLLTKAVTLAPRFGPAFRLLADTRAVLGRQADADRARAQASRLAAFAPYADPMVDALARVSRSATFLLRQASDADLDTSGAWSEFLLRRALAFDPGNADVLAKLGRALRTQGRNAEALDAFVAYHAKEPGDFRGIAQIGSSLTELGRLEEAERYLREALTGLDDAQTHYNLGVVLSGLKRPADAGAEYRRAIDRDPYLVDARNNLAALLAREGRLADATAELTRVLEIEPDNAVALANLRIVRGGK